MKDFITGLSKWPLLLGAVIAYALAIYEETVTDTTEIAVAIAGIVVGSVLLGTWLALYIIDFERRWERLSSDRQTESGPPPESEGGGPDALLEGTGEGVD
jgi:Na+/glutamate symporter